MLAERIPAPDSQPDGAGTPSSEKLAALAAGVFATLNTQAGGATASNDFPVSNPWKQQGRREGLR